MERKLMVSVDMITYKHEDFIAQAIEGVLMQETNFEFDLIIADDCSPDKTEEIVKNIINTHPKGHIIKYFRHEKNIGMQPNATFALMQCKGKYTAVCEGDDYWTDPLKLQKQVDFLEANDDYSMVFTGASVLLEDNTIKEEINLNIETREYSGDEIFKNWIVPTVSVLFRTKFSNFIIENFKFKGVAYGDIIVFLTLAEYGKIYCFSNETCVYRRNSFGVTVSNPLNGFKAIQHYDAMNNIFNNKYNQIVEFSKSKIYLNIGLMGLKKYNLFSFKYIINSIYYDKKVLFNYLKIRCNITNE